MSGKSRNHTEKAVKEYIDLLYMSSNELNAKDISLLLQDSPGMRIELWEEMNILELELSNQNSVDFEPLSISFKSPSDAAFVRNRNIKTIFAINLCETDLAIVVSIIEKIISKYSGFLCADSQDFMPVYAGSTKLS